MDLVFCVNYLHAVLKLYIQENVIFNMPKALIKCIFYVNDVEILKHHLYQVL